MKFTNLLAAWHVPHGGRRIQPVNKVPLQEILPLKLKDRVSGKSDKKSEGNCLFEMTLLITCLEQKGYENKLCEKEVNSFKSCYQNFRDASFKSKKIREKGILVPDEKNLTRKQLKNLFARRPMS